MVNVHKEGDSVYAKVDPTVELTVRRFIKDIYYCQIKGNEEAKDLVYFEHELVAKNIEKNN